MWSSSPSTGSTPPRRRRRPPPGPRCRGHLLPSSPSAAPSPSPPRRSAGGPPMTPRPPSPLVGGGWLVADADTGARRRVRFADIAVLIPARSALPPLEEAFENAGVPYRLEGAELLWGAEEVRDLLAVLRAADDPADAVAMIGALRIPGPRLRGRRPGDLVPRPAGAGTPGPMSRWAWRTIRWPGHGPSSTGCTAGTLVVGALGHGAAACREPPELRSGSHASPTPGPLAPAAMAAGPGPPLRRDPGRDPRGPFSVGPTSSAEGDRRWRGGPARPRRRRRACHDHPWRQRPRVPRRPPDRSRTGSAGRAPASGRRLDRHRRSRVHVGLFRSAGFDRRRLREQHLDALEQHRLLYVGMTRARDHVVSARTTRSTTVSPIRAMAARSATRISAITRRCGGG